MKKIMFVVALGTSWLTVAGGSVAAPITAFPTLIDNDWYTTDTTQQIDFLDIDTPEIQAKTRAFFEGGYTHSDGSEWRLATVNEVLGFWNQALPAVHDTGFDITFDHEEVVAPIFLDLVGRTFDDADISQAVGWIAEQRTPDTWWDAFINEWHRMPDDVDIWSTDGFGSATSELSAWLVRDTVQVPEPGSVTVFGLGLISLWFTLRRCRRASEFRATRSLCART